MSIEQTIRMCFLLYTGPFEVKEVKFEENVYVVIDPKTRIIQGTYNINQL